MELDFIADDQAKIQTNEDMPCVHCSCLLFCVAPAE
jgi:hypothetical protein